MTNQLDLLRNSMIANAESSTIETIKLDSYKLSSKEFIDLGVLSSRSASGTIELLFTNPTDFNITDCAGEYIIRSYPSTSRPYTRAMSINIHTGQSTIIPGKYTLSSPDDYLSIDASAAPTFNNESLTASNVSDNNEYRYILTTNATRDTATMVNVLTIRPGITSRSGKRITFSGITVKDNYLIVGGGAELSISAIRLSNIIGLGGLSSHDSVTLYPYYNLNEEYNHI